MIETLKVDMEAPNGGMQSKGSAIPKGDKEAKLEASKPPMFKGIRNAQEVDNFLQNSN